MFYIRVIMVQRKTKGKQCGYNAIGSKEGVW